MDYYSNVEKLLRYQQRESGKNKYHFTETSDFEWKKLKQIICVNYFCAKIFLIRINIFMAIIFCAVFTGKAQNIFGNSKIN